MSRKGDFRSERHLVRVARSLIREALRETGVSARLRYEVGAPGGIPDLVLFRGSSKQLQYVVTVEFKLSDWRRGLYQSFRSRNYGNEAYLVLDSGRVGSALECYDLFKRANVGLLSIAADRSLQAWYYPEPHVPFSKEFSNALACSLFGTRRRGAKDLVFTRSVRGGAGLSKLRRLWGPPCVEGVPVSPCT